MIRTIAWATLVAGTLDILMAVIDTLLSGGNVARMLGSVASGPFGDGIRDSSAAAPLGLLVHFAIMAVMAAVYVVAARSVPALNRYWWLFGALYGIVLWLIMYWIVLPARFEGFTPPSEAIGIAKGLFAHCVLVGLPLAFIARRARAVKLDKVASEIGERLRPPLRSGREVR
jgi:hypothetical protein